MQTRACVLHAQEDVRIETCEVGEMGPQQVLVRIGAGGICGSDIHYYWEGGIGTIRVTEPITMGHEVAGVVEAVGANVTRVRPGDRIAVCPSRPCGKCKFCLDGEQQHCLEMQFFGSAMRKPHTHGGFRDRLIAEEFQCEPMGDKVSLGEAACTEPLAVGVHAVNQAGNLMGKRVLVTGAGPIGALLIGGILLLWVCWKMWRELRMSNADDHNVDEVLANADLNADGTIAGGVPNKTFKQAAWQIVIADVSMSLDNVLAVAGAAREHPTVLIIGLVLSIALMGLAASFIARLLHKHRWIAYVGLAIILYVALDMIWRGWHEVQPIVLSALG